MTCIICNSPSDRHHVKTRKSGGCDSEFNIMHICRSHHTQVHKIGMIAFANKYPVVERWLLSNKWELCSVKKKWTRYNF